MGRHLAKVVAVAVAVCGMVVLAQPPEGGPPGGPGSGGPGGGRRGPPSPERLVEHAFEYDADGDGKLDRAEMTKFAQAFHEMRMRGGPGGSQGGADGPRAGGRGQSGGRGTGEGRGPGGPGDDRRGPPPGGDGERPERPRRPE